MEEIREIERIEEVEEGKDLNDADEAEAKVTEAEAKVTEAEADEAEAKGVSAPESEEAAEAAEAAEASEAEEATVVDVERLLAEAEERGYLRGLNERIEELMGSPAMYERIDGKGRGMAGGASTEVMILGNMRKSVWD